MLRLSNRTHTQKRKGWGGWRTFDSPSCELTRCRRSRINIFSLLFFFSKYAAGHIKHGRRLAQTAEKQNTHITFLFLIQHTLQHNYCNVASQRRYSTTAVLASVKELLPNRAMTQGNGDPLLPHKSNTKTEPRLIKLRAASSHVREHKAGKIVTAEMFQPPRTHQRKDANRGSFISPCNKAQRTTLQTHFQAFYLLFHPSARQSQSN